MSSEKKLETKCGMCCLFGCRWRGSEKCDWVTTTNVEGESLSVWEKHGDRQEEFVAEGHRLQRASFPCFFASLDDRSPPLKWRHRQYRLLGGSGCPLGQPVVAASTLALTGVTSCHNKYHATLLKENSKSSISSTKKQNASKSGNGGASYCRASSRFVLASQSSSSVAYSNAYVAAKRRTLGTVSRHRQKRKLSRNIKLLWVKRNLHLAEEHRNQNLRVPS